MTPAEAARADVEAWLHPITLRHPPPRALPALVAILTAVYERVWRAEAEWASWKRLADLATTRADRAVEENAALHEQQRIAEVVRDNDAALLHAVLNELGVLSDVHGGRDVLEAVRERLAVLAPADPPCAGCGGPHPYDTTLPSPLWNRVVRAAGLPDYLCTTCIVAAFVRAGESFEAELYGEPVNRPGSVAPTIRVLVGERPLADTYGALQHEVRTLREQLARARAVWAARDGEDYDWWEAMGAALAAELPP